AHTRALTNGPAAVPASSRLVSARTSQSATNQLTLTSNMLLDLIGMIFAYLWLLIQWLLEAAVHISTHAIHNITLLPSYIGGSVLDATRNWYNFFSSDIPSFLATFYHAAIWFFKAGAKSYAYLDDIYTDFAEYLYDAFGSPIDDITEEDWNSFYQSTIVFIIIFFICLALKWYCEQEYTSTPFPESPIVEAEQGQHKGKAHHKGHANNSPPRNQPSTPRLAPKQYADLPPHLKPTGYFRTPQPDLPFTRTIHTAERFLNDGSRRIKLYGAWRSVSRQPTEEEERTIEQSIKEAARLQHHTIGKLQHVEPLENSTPPHMRIEIVSSPPEHRQPAQARPVANHVRSLADIPSVPSPLIHTNTPRAGIISQQVRAENQTYHENSSHLTSAEDVIGHLHEKSDALSFAIGEFLRHIKMGSSEYEPHRDYIKQSITEAFELLSEHLTGRMPGQLAERFQWTALVIAFWFEVQPLGYMFFNHSNPMVGDVVRLVGGFGWCLGIEFEDPNMSIPAPPAQPTEAVQAPPKPTPQPAQASSQPPGNVFGYQPLPVRQSGRSAASRSSAARSGSRAAAGRSKSR
ncbi:hypothetical protein BKA63DRAFT_589357, partial [Paraphoma chrysanthemicola]